MANNEKRLQGLRVAALAETDFEQVELTEPRQALEQAGAQVVLISSEPGQIDGMNHDQKADKFPVDQTLDQAQAADFDAVLLPGGALNADKLRMIPEARRFVQEADRAGKPLAVICHAPWLLVSAGLVRGRTLTSYYTLQDDIRNAGGNWMDRAPVRDRNWITARNPDDIPAFNQAMLDLFAEHTAGTHAEAGNYMHTSGGASAAQ